MSDNPNDDGGVDWNAVIDLLREGKTAVIPCPNERDYARLRRGKPSGPRRRELPSKSLRARAFSASSLVQPPAPLVRHTTGESEQWLWETGRNARSGARTPSRANSRCLIVR